MTVYLDVNRNRVLDDREPHTVTMADDPFTDFDEGGLYWFDGLPAGEHAIGEVVPDGYDQTFPELGVQVTDSQTVVLRRGVALDFDLTGAEAELGPDGQRVVELELTVVWPDSCGTIIGELTEHEIDNGVVHVDIFGHQPGTVCAEVISPQPHLIRVVLPDDAAGTLVGRQHERRPSGPQLFVPALGLEAHFSLDGSGQHQVHLEAGEQVDGIDFGNRPVRRGSIHGVKFEDVNGNGQFDGAEQGLAGVTIYVDANRNGRFDADEPHAVTMEEDPFTDFDEGGLYWLDGLPAGEHVVREVVPDGFVQTFPARDITEPAALASEDEGFSTVNPDRIDVTLLEGQTSTTEVSLTIDPLCIRPFEVDVVASDPDADVQNLTGVQVNGCGGDTSTFAMQLTGQGHEARFDLEFIDVEFGGVLEAISMVISLPGTGSGAHLVILDPGDVVDGVNFGNQRRKPDDPPAVIDLLVGSTA